MIRPSGISNSFIVMERMHTDLLHQGNKGNEEFCLAPFMSKGEGQRGKSHYGTTD
jgi:hypothetical protein